MYISSDSSLSSSCFSWMSRNQSTMRASSEASAERGWLGTGRAGLRGGGAGPRVELAEGFGEGVRPGLTLLGRTQALLQLHTLELQGIQLPLDVLHLPLDLLLGHVVRVQLGMRAW